MLSKKQQEAEEYKEKGNACVKDNNYAEALIYYSHAIKLDPRNHILYSNRSHTFLKLQQYYLALEDAKRTIQLQSNWPKGYYRKGNVEAAVGHYRSALLSFGRAMLLDPHNTEVKEAVRKTNDECFKLRQREWRDPIVCGVCGVVVGILILLADQRCTKKTSVRTNAAQIVIVMIFSLIGYFGFKAYRYIRDKQKSALLEKPVDLLDEMGTTSPECNDREIPVDSNPNGYYNEMNMNTHKSDQNDSKSKPRRRGGANLGRQKFKMGKAHS